MGRERGRPIRLWLSLRAASPPGYSETIEKQISCGCALENLASFSTNSFMNGLIVRNLCVGKNP